MTCKTERTMLLHRHACLVQDHDYLLPPRSDAAMRIVLATRQTIRDTEARLRASGARFSPATFTIR